MVMTDRRCNTTSSPTMGRTPMTECETRGRRARGARRRHQRQRQHRRHCNGNGFFSALLCSSLLMVGIIISQANNLIGSVAAGADNESIMLPKIPVGSLRENSASGPWSGRQMKTMAVAAEEKSVKADDAAKSWEDDDDDDKVGKKKAAAAAVIDNVVSVNSSAEDDDDQGKYGKKEVVGQSVSGEKKEGLTSGGPGDDDDDMAQEKASNTKKEAKADNAVIAKHEGDAVKEETSAISDTKQNVDKKTFAAGEKKKQTASEWPDEDDDDETNLGKLNAGSVASADLSAEGASQKSDEKEGEEGSEGDKKGSPSDWPDDDDDDAKVQGASNVENESLTSNIAQENEVNASAKASPSKADDENVDGGKTKQDWPDDDDDDTAAIGTKAGSAKDGMAMESGGIDHNDGNDLILPRDEISSMTAYHRNQSSEGEGVAGEEEDHADTVADATAENANEAAGLAAEDPGETMSQEESGGTRVEDGSVQDIPDGAMTGGDANGLAAQNIDGIAAGSEGLPIDGNVPMGGNPNDVIVPGAEQGEQQQQQQQQQQIPIGNKDWYDDQDESSFLDNIKFTFQVLLMAAVFTSVLVFRKRVMGRMDANPSRGVPAHMMDELIDVTLKLASWAAEKMREHSNRGSSGSGAGERHNSSSSRSAGAGRNGPETIPLSTATDEEWGWEDDDMGTTDFEMSGMAGGGSEDQAKEDDDLAMAIAMSMSENEKGAKVATIASSAPRTIFPSTSLKANNAINKQTLSTTSRSSSNSGSSLGSFKKDTVKPTTPLRKNSGPTPPPRVPAVETAPTPPPSAPVSGNSIEDLLGQMGGAGGPMITSFGQKPKSIAKPKATPKKNDMEDDMFASMGLSSNPYSSSGASSSRPAAAPASSGWQATAATRAQPSMNSAPLQSLLADTMDDDDMDADSWGDDGDLDDLLDD